MPTTTLLSLPREIRDEIYRMVLLPASAPYLTEPYRIEHQATSKRKSRAKARLQRYALGAPFKLCLNPLEGSPSTMQETDFYHTSLSLLRVNQQIYSETRDLFWHNVTFYFPLFKFLTLSTGKSVFHTLKGMGQIPSRLIRRIRIEFDFLKWNTSEVPKILQLLASRSRFGDFKMLELAWDAAPFSELVEANSASVVSDTTDSYDMLLEELRDGSTSCRYERVIRLLEHSKSVKLLGGLTSEEIQETVRVLHFACGGSLYWQKKLVWQHYQKVDEIHVCEIEDLVDGLAQEL